VSEPLNGLHINGDYTLGFAQLTQSECLPPELPDNARRVGPKWRNCFLGDSIFGLAGGFASLLHAVFANIFIAACQLCMRRVEIEQSYFEMCQRFYLGDIWIAVLTLLIIFTSFWLQTILV